MKSVIWRSIATVFAMLLYGWTNFLLNAAGTVLTGAVAGRQFENSSTDYVVSMVSMGIFSHLGVPTLVLIVAVIAIWWAPLKALLRTLFLAALLLLGVFTAQPASAYYDKTDYAEAYVILPNETAFWLPEVANGKDNQAQYDSEDLYKANRVPLKRFVVPHTHLQGSGSFFDFYVPAGRLMIVDRTPYSREWVDAPERGTSARREGFPCQTKEGLDFGAGVSIGASVLERSAATYLYRFGVVAPVGERTDPKVIFTSVFYSRKLSDVMDDVGRKKVQTLVCGQIFSRTFNKANAEGVEMMTAIQKEATEYFASVGITLDFIGWADTFTFNKDVQAAVNRKYIAEVDQANAVLLAPYADTIQKLAAADALRAFGVRADGKLPTTIVGLPAGVNGLLGALFGLAAPAAAAPPPPAH